jgi:hypothetical protein
MRISFFGSTTAAMTLPASVAPVSRRQDKVITNTHKNHRSGYNVKETTPWPHQPLYYYKALYNL